MHSNLNKLENESIFIFRQAYRSISNIALLWSLGKDSNVMVWLAFKAFLGKIPFPVVHVDTGKKFRGIIAGIRRDEQGTRAKERVFSPRDDFGKWNIKNQPPEFWNYSNFNYPETVHVRIHPLLNWTELDIWQYIKQEKIPVVDLYFSKKGKRYRSLGDQDITFPINSNAKTVNEIIEELKVSKVSERSGRAMDHEEENVFERLRSKGYM